MPSVPQSLLWISLVVLWLFVLVPMLISKRDAVRRTSDVALATRVLNSGLARKRKKGGPAAGHRSDPDWQPIDEGDELDDGPAEKGVVVKAASAMPEQGYLDVDIVEEDSGALPVGASEADQGKEPEGELEPAFQSEAEPQPKPDGEPVAADEEAADQEAVDEENDGTSDEYETVEDTSGLESEEEPPTAQQAPIKPRRRLYESNTAAAVSARKYRFRKRVLSAMALVLAATTGAAVTVWPDGWWACGAAGVITILYLAYLRRQTRIEEQVRRRRMQRMARSRLGVQNTADREYDLPSRLRRPGSVVLEIDDEDPIFEHLDHVPGPMGYHLPRASGQ
jgi:hypothetical protein